MPILINAGRSRFGWSRAGSFFHCLQLGAYTEILQLDLGGRDPLERGTLGHLGAAHQYARWRAQQRKDDPEAYYPREAAMEEFARIEPQYAPHLGRMVDTLRRYFAKNPEPPGQIHTVEDEFVGCIGWKRLPSGEYALGRDGQPRFDLWLVDRVFAATVTNTGRYSQGIPAWDPGCTIEPATLQMSGHPRQGCPILVSRRWDLAYDNRKGQTLLLDHKMTAADASSARAFKYAPDGQFSINRLLAAQAFPAFTGDVWVNLVRTEEPWTFKAFAVPPTPWRDMTIAAQVYHREHTVAKLLVDRVDPWHYPRADHELVCEHRYGSCSARHLCDFGPGALKLPTPSGTP